MTTEALDLSRLAILVVEDNHHMRALIKNVLKVLGVGPVYTAPSAVEALQLLKTTPVDIVFTDWHMTPLDGMDLTRLIRTGEDSANPLVPIVMLTGHTEQHRVVEARDVGVDEYLAKPISARSIYSRLHSIIMRRRSFIRTADYFGPDRRRRDDPDFKGPHRRATDPDDLREDAEDATPASEVEVIEAEAIAPSEQDPEKALEEELEQVLATEPKDGARLETVEEKPEPEPEKAPEPAIDPSAMTQEELAKALDKKGG